MMIMRGKGERRPRGAAPGTGRPNPRCGRHRQTRAGWPWRPVRRSLCGYVLAGLAVIALGITWSLGLVGCGPVPSSSYTDATPGAFFPNSRQSSLEVSRLLRNAHYYKLMGRPELALKELEQAHRQNPDNLKLINILAQNYEELGQFETARKLYQEALTRNGPNPALANNLCFTYYLEGRYQEAETCFRQTLALDPNNEAARNNLGLLYCRLGRQDEARRLWQEVEGSAAADYKTRQALAALGMADRAVYAQRTAPAPAAVAPVSPPSASTPGTRHSPAATLAPQKVAMQVAPQPAPEQPAPDPVKPGPEAQPKPVPEQAAPAPAPQATSRSLPPYLTCAELVDTAIEVLNGTRTHNLAHRTRTLLSLEGFSVPRIGNYIDFGAEKTVIYYRPEAQRVARALGETFFPGAGLESTTKLHKDIAVKILLGADLLERPQLMARLAIEAP